MTTAEFLAYLRQLDIQVWLEGANLRCSAPEGALTPELRAAIAQRKSELLHWLNQAHASAHQAAPELKPISRNQPLPLSFAQQRLWFLDQLVPENPFYNMPSAVRLSGHLHLKALEQAFAELVQRHETLRTRFAKVDGQPTQIITPALPLSIPVTDLQSLDSSAQEETVRQIATEEAHCPFDLTVSPLLRVKLLQLEATEYLLLLNLHHIISDGWSLGVLMRELGALYTAFAEGQPSPLSELPIQYADFAHWQRQWLQGEVLESQLAYWRQQLQDLPVLNLPIDHPRPATQSYKGAIAPLALSHQLTQALEELSQQAGTTLFMTLLAAFQALLFRYTGQTNVAVGSPIANRNRSEIEGLIGFFVNSLVLRTDLSGNPTFRELLERSREVALAAYAHQDVPFEKLVEELHPERDLSRNPLFQVAFALQNAPMAPLELPGLTLSPWKLDVGTARFDLEFHIWEQAEGLSGLWDTPREGLSGFVAYSTELFELATITRMIGHFQTLLEGIVANPDQRLADLSILNTAEQHQLLVEWNQTQVEYDKDVCIHHLFAAQAEKTPDAIAVSAPSGNVGVADQQLTYQELDQRANQLAHYLQQVGVGTETLVGICVDRSLDVLIAILGVWKAGGAYVPLDPEYPRDRLQFMLQDSQVLVLLTQRSHVEVFDISPFSLQEESGKPISGEDQTLRVICLDQDRELIAQQKQSAPASVATADHLAYVIYTSGSTGMPKGVMVEHRGLCNVVAAQQQSFNLPLGSRVLQFSAWSFDASIFEMLMALGSRGTLYIVPQSARSPGIELVQFLQTQSIAAAILPPAVLALLPENDLSTLQTVIAGGEACSGEIVRKWAQGRRLFNAYGPTETTIWATVAELTHRAESPEKPSIGRPVANIQIYVLDAHQQPVPIGVVGELYIGGDGVARGYLNRPDLTAERFIPCPFSASPGARLYKTGDLARYRSDGLLEFIGRADEQVKIRGFRMELGEIEAVLQQHPLVKGAIATVQESASGDQQLTAYVSFHPEREGAGMAIAQQLQQEQVEHWQTLYDQTYAQPVNSADPTFNIVGWNSSYTGQPIPIEQMREWVDRRVEQILALQPQRVLEIGCGTGLLLFQLAPHYLEYWATDFSQISLSTIQQQLNQQQLPPVKLLHRSANDFAGIEPARFDLIVLNSVVQYFPSVDYLVQVLEGALQALAPGGSLFIGDVRNLALWSAFHASVQMEQASPALERSHLQQQVQRAMFEEPELLIDPEFFQALRSHFPQIQDIQIQLTRGQAHNEMTQFRYNVILQKETQVREMQEQQPLVPTNLNVSEWDWTNELTIAMIRRHLIEAQPARLTVRGVLNARVIAAVAVAAWLAEVDGPKTVGHMRTALEQLAEPGVDPEAWWSLEQELPYDVNVSWAAVGSDRYDVTLQHREVKAERRLEPEAIAPARPWSTYANQPLQRQLARQLVPQIRNYLEQKLPNYMVPTAFVVLETLPLTPSGKIDRRALPAPVPMGSTQGYVAPRSPIEAKLVSIWSELLGVKRVGLHDNFFELGGHSLLATQLTSRIRDAFAVELPLRHLFESPTIAQLAQQIDSLQVSQPQPSIPAIVPLSRDAYRRSRSSLNQNQGK
ncbi:MULTISPECIES: non-ribosomal peptide synthetase [Trichocoleus]|uniref:Non-ribosomal peptide synthetase n=1 Tax=Trichocoleus desertorum GB2-A4 TaxID=2933944 RepID=A0ABV0JFT8_9CYAN|nr:non-ribosomal peptide synthetase [Trichocoleus sp. FACHB-46]MBD1861335.1 amino acid adenylation domain-containing protein [Trichocoleus sp. FACHB-46]